MTTTDRPGYTAGLRALADILDQHPEVPLPYHGSHVPMVIHHLGLSDEERDAFRATVSALPGTKTKSTELNGYFDVDAQIAGLKVQVTAYRDAVCKRSVTGTREVSREIPDPAALAAVPTVTVTETVEDVEWNCLPLTAPAAEAVPA